MVNILTLEAKQRDNKNNETFFNIPEPMEIEEQEEFIRKEIEIEY